MDVRSLPLWNNMDQSGLTLMLLVTNLAKTKGCKNPGKKTLPHGYMLTESYPININTTGYRWFSNNLYIQIILYLG